MKPRAHLETTLVSYLTARASRNPIFLAHQKISWQWWRLYRTHYDLFVSRLVIDESLKGDYGAAQRRMRLIGAMPVLELTRAARDLAQALVKRGAVPLEAATDALHIAVASVNELDYLITWNCRHIANAFRRHHIEDICKDMGRHAPVICTPEELMEE